MAGTATRRFERRRQARRELEQLWRQPNMLQVIHYSSEALSTNADGVSPRITGIAVRNVGSGRTTSFSIHQTAEERHVDINEIDRRYDELESEMLTSFFDFMRARPDHKWIHWNMRDITYGFPALEHRFRIVKPDDQQTLPRVADADLYDFNFKLQDIYGRDYIAQPRLITLMKRNNVSLNNLLSGEEEAEAFAQKEFGKLRLSTLRKVDVIHTLAQLEWDGTLNTDAKWWDRHGASMMGVVEAITDHWIYKLLGFAGILAGLSRLLMQLREAFT